jgi:putative redox protein
MVLTGRLATMSDTTVVTVTETEDGRYAQEITAGANVLTADEPPDKGGDDTGPDPYSLLLAALGACTSMTLRMYAERKGLPLTRVSVTLEHTRIHAKDCAECETKVGRIDHIQRDITLEGDLDGAQRARMLEIANMCPVHRTLRSEVVIDSSLEGA